MSWGSYLVGFASGFLVGVVLIAALAIHFFGPILDAVADTTDAMGRR